MKSRGKKSRDVKKCPNINQFKLKMAVLSTPFFKALLCFKIEANTVEPVSSSIIVKVLCGSV